MKDFRFRLREETSEAHTRLDKSLVKYDLSTYSGLASYLCVHYLARYHLHDSIFGHENLRDDGSKLEDLRHDFDQLGLSAPKWHFAPKAEPHHALGLTYVMAGSSLGGKLLYKDWARADDPAVQAASRFMTNAKSSTSWKMFLTYLDNSTFLEKEIQDIIKSANYCFGVFEAANQEISGRKP